MFVTKNQFYVFVACVAFGTFLAFLFCIVRLVRYLSNNKYFPTIIEFVFLAISGFLFSCYSHILFFPNFRPYMLIGVFSGFFGYLKSFHIILAKIIKKFYNRIVKNCIFLLLKVLWTNSWKLPKKQQSLWKRMTVCTYEYKKQRIRYFWPAAFCTSVGNRTRI